MTIPRRALIFFPFTSGGTFLFIISLYLLYAGLKTGNPYGLLLSLAALLFLIILIILGRFQAFRFSRTRLQWDSSAALYAGTRDSAHRLYCAQTVILFFFRLHFIIRGKMKVGKSAWVYIYREASLAKIENHTIPLYFPLCGVFPAKAGFEVRDIFGLTRAGFGSNLERRLIIQPAPVSCLELQSIEPEVGFEEKSRKKSSDEQKYYMREYIPGDRLRDINWKASSRFDELITRISPVTQEKSVLVSVDFRHYRKKQRETVESILHLNYLKSRLISFLKKNKIEHPEYKFRIRTGKGIEILDTVQDIERFSRDISILFFQEDPYIPGSLSEESEIFIFTTPFDETLHSVSLPQTKIHVFSTASAGKAGVDDTAALKTAVNETLRVFNSTALPIIPGAWIFLRERLKPVYQSAAWETFQFTTLEVRLL